MSQIKKVVLAYSGGLDTSVILKWLQDEYKCEVVTFTADIGQGEELEPARAKAKAAGVKSIYIDDLREEFVRDFVFPMFRANTVYEGEYLLGTSIARPLIAKRLVEIARAEKADAISHGATGKGNDQVRFELGAYALMPNVKIIAPWREWDLTSREKLLAYADTHGIPVDFKKRKGESPFSMDANLLHISYEGGILEDPAAAPPEKGMWRLTVSPEKAPSKPELVELQFERGDLVAINGQRMKAHELLAELNRLGGKHGVGRLDLVENRYVGMKSRGCYETPGGTILLRAHRAIESLTLDREVAHLKDELMPRYASLVYNGYWWSPERTALQVLIDHTQERVNGTVTLKLFKGNVIITGRSSADSLFDAKIVTFEEDEGAYDQADAGGFIKLNALRMRIAASKAQAERPRRAAAKKAAPAKPAAKPAARKPTA
ncbi:argininosuccinate synthase [Quisquiliibacterium transsilvanicum]|uniref:Argininosuccinate synthase n=1 Tax=Quisquiliibacterium transsilvanicum TaxID=1549638 RepID=A0A7W8HES3_9BURK|nr:argininosuccinate synthase [Quisquiliibacterium transsilvanicum]MBB5270769.1 argininosuccinate synthase [Quisquiliibacterium transsilvanicum]